MSLRKMINFSISVLLVLLGLSIRDVSAGNTTYVVALLGQDIQNATVNPDIKYELVLTTKSTSPISVDIRGINGLIATLEVDETDKTVYELDQTAGMNGSEYSNKSIIVHSTDGLFLLQVFIKRDDHSYIEGFLGIPIQSLIGPHQPVGQIVYSYVVATFCDVGGYCQLAVSALNDATAISINLPSHVEEIVCCRGKSYLRSKRDTAITLDKFDSLQFESTFDITGTVIYSFQPIVVFVGSRNVTNGGVVTHTVEQLVPTSHWGTEYIVTNLGINGYGDILKIVSHWSDTKITMKGFPSFVMKDRYQTAVRRLDKGFSSHIQASHPIQVVQISGLTYATENETSTLSMTVVPSVQNAYTEPITVACHGAAAEQAQFYITSEKLSASSTKVNGGGYGSNSEIEIKYSDYMTGVIEHTGTTYSVENTGGDAISGVMKCGTAIMPTAVPFNENVTGTSSFTATYSGGTCYEGGKATTLFDSSSDTATPYSLDLQTHPDHVLQLRVRVCGEAVLQFFMNDNDLSNSLFITVTHKQMTVTKCFPGCGTSATAVIADTAEFNSGASTDWDCQADMAFFWFRQKTEATKQYICFGIGKYDETVCDGGETNSYFEIASRFKNVKMMGVASDAAFNWDFVHIEGCDLYESDWRCMDRWTNCSMYGTSFCSGSQHNSFALSYCAKYCGKCFADSYGRKFLLRTPRINPVGDTDCLIIVSPLNKQTNVAVTLTNTVTNDENVQHGKRNDNGERYYDCIASLNILDTYTILSDDDVTVVILINFNEEIKSTRVYPVDTFGTEVMVLEYSDEQKHCRFVSEHDSVNFVAYYSINKQSGNKDSQRALLTVGSTLTTTNMNDMSGTIFKFDKPSAVFCGDAFTSTSAANHYNQHLPTNTWSTEYVVPAFDEEAINRPFDGKLLIVSNADNTIVNISGGFDAIHAVYNRGDKIEQEIDVGAAYQIKASENIGVGLYLYDPTDVTKTSFSVLVPVQNFHDTVLVSAPNTMLNDIGFGVTEIKTYTVDRNLNTQMMSKEADDTDPFYRHVSIGDDIFEMTVVQSGTEKWFVVPGNVKSTVLQTVEQVCEMSSQATGDGIDNDCDGLKDEDVCYSTYGVYREDRDLDGGFGEDCSEVLNEPVVVSTPREPLCLEIKKPKDQCWTICTCKCSWVEKYEAQKNLTHDELVEAQQDEIQQLQNELHVDEESLQTASALKESASDERQSAANIGYVGIGLFALVFGTIFIMDISSLVRDGRILVANLCEGFGRLKDCFKRKMGG